MRTFTELLVHRYILCKREAILLHADAAEIEAGNQVRQWAESGFLADLMDRLLDHGFTVFLTSDHGNIEAASMGRPMEGAVADLRGERARVYRNLGYGYQQPHQKLWS